MATLRNIDISALKATFRAAAAARGIDPLEGATSFQVAQFCAERDAADRHNLKWWKDSSLWAYAPPYASLVEEAALRNVFDESYINSLTLREGETGHSLIEEVSILPLRERLAERGEKLVWVDLGNGITSSVIRPLSAEVSIPIAETATFADLDERVQRAISMRLSGDSYSLIAATLNVDKAEVIRWIKKYRKANADAGTELYEPPHRRHSHEMRCAALEMYQSGMSANSIGQQLGINNKTIWRWVHSR